jgi:hypothetical protein
MNEAESKNQKIRAQWDLVLNVFSIALVKEIGR